LYPQSHLNFSILRALIHGKARLLEGCQTKRKATVIPGGVYIFRAPWWKVAVKMKILLIIAYKINLIFPKADAVGNNGLKMRR